MAVSFIWLLTLAYLSSTEAALETVSQLEPGRYVGRWYQMYTNGWTDLFSNLPNPTCVTADYAAINATYISVYNANYALGTNVFESISGYAFIPNLDEPGKLKVSLEGVPVVGDYWVLKLGPVYEGLYEYSIITDGENELQLFVLARDPQRFYDIYDREVQEYITIIGFDTPGLKQYAEVPQTDECVYAPLS